MQNQGNVEILRPKFGQYIKQPEAVEFEEVAGKPVPGILLGVYDKNAGVQGVSTGTAGVVNGLSPTEAPLSTLETFLNSAKGEGKQLYMIQDTSGFAPKGTGKNGMFHGVYSSHQPIGRDRLVAVPDKLVNQVRELAMTYHTQGYKR